MERLTELAQSLTAREHGEERHTCGGELLTITVSFMCPDVKDAVARAEKTAELTRKIRDAAHAMGCDVDGWRTRKACAVEDYTWPESVDRSSHPVKT